MPGRGSPLLEVKGLHTHFSTRGGIVNAVNGVSFSLNQGEVLGVVGESGCGKSVTALSIMRLIASPTGEIVSGQVILDGRDLLPLSEREMRKVRGNDIAMVFQEPMSSLNPQMRIGRQIDEALQVHKGLSTSAARGRTIELLEMVGLPDPKGGADSYPHQLSGGMRQRVMIALALSCEPKLLIADEPTTALDVTIQAQILSLLDTLRAELGMAVLIISHDLGLVAGIADRIVVMYAGHVAETAGVEEIFARPRHPYTLGLLGSLPRIDEPRRKRLKPIEGFPPDLVDLPRGCPFHPRCWLRRQLGDPERCVSERPLLQDQSPDHAAACHFAEELETGDRSCVMS